MTARVAQINAFVGRKDPWDGEKWWMRQPFPTIRRGLCKNNNCCLQQCCCGKNFNVRPPRSLLHLSRPAGKSVQNIIIIIINNNNNRIQRRYSRFFTISSQRRELSPTRTLKWPGRNRVEITCNATHLALFTCNCHVTCHLVRSDSSAIKFDRVEIAFI